MQGITNWYIRIGEWALNLFLLNILWFLSLLLGLVVVGVFPATVALFTVMRKLTMGSEDISVVKLVKLFWKSFKTDFYKANILGYSITLIGIILYVDLKWLQSLNSIIHQSLSIAFIIIIFVYLLTLLYLFPVFVHFNLRTIEYMKYALILALGRPIQSLLMIAGLVVTLYLLKLVPGLIPVFGVSLISFCLMKIASISLPKEDLVSK